MYPISAEVKALFDSEQRQVLRITGTDRNGTDILITDENVRMNGFSIDRYSCNGQKLEVGTAIASEMTLKLDNSDGQYNDVVFEGTELFVEVGIADWTQETPSITYIPCGYFTPDQQPRRLSTITIKAMDRMRTLDRTQPTPIPWTTDTDAVITDNNGTQIDFNAYVAFPTTIQNLVNQVCVHCGVTMATDLSVFPNYNYNLLKMPLIQQQFTYRNIIQWCAGFMGANAWFDWNGQLRFSWYDNATGYETDITNRFSSDLFEDDIEITGVQYTNSEGAVIFAGSLDYTLDLSDNLMMANVIGEVLPILNTALNGFTYRPMSAEVINAPYLWPMDVVTFEDKDGNTHTSVLTNVNFGINGETVIESVGLTKQSNDYTNPTITPIEQAKLINEAINHTDQLDASLNQEGIFNRLTNNGEAQGIYMMDGKLYINMTYARSGTLVLGGLNNENGLLQVLDALGRIIVQMNNDGAVINGSITSAYSDNYNSYEMGINKGAVIVRKNGVITSVIRGSTDNQGTMQIRGEHKIEIGTDDYVMTDPYEGPNTYDGFLSIEDGAIKFQGTSHYFGAGPIYVIDTLTAPFTTYMQGISENLDIAGDTIKVRNGLIVNHTPGTQGITATLRLADVNSIVVQNGVITNYYLRS